MGKRGPKRTPTATLKLRGSRLAAGRTDTARVKAALPSMPRWLGTHAKTEWKCVAKPLRDAGILTELDRTALALYCCAVDDFLTCREIIAHDGSILTSAKGGRYVHPAVSMMQNAWSRVLKGGAEFGLSPTSRPSIYAVTPPPPDLLDEFLRSKDGKSGKDRYRRPS